MANSYCFVFVCGIMWCFLYRSVEYFVLAKEGNVAVAEVEALNVLAVKD